MQVGSQIRELYDTRHAGSSCTASNQEMTVE